MLHVQGGQHASDNKSIVHTKMPQTLFQLNRAGCTRLGRWYFFLIEKDLKSFVKSSIILIMPSLCAENKARENQSGMPNPHGSVGQEVKRLLCCDLHTPA